MLEATWLSESKMMSTEDCKQEFLNYLDVVRQQQSKAVVADARNMFFTFGPKMQIWIDQTIHAPLISMGVNKIAFVVSKDFFSSLSTKQTMGESAGLKFTTQYFDSKEAAKKWILSVA